MASAIVMAGGGGTRTEQFVPKQFLTVNDIPVIVYTMMMVQKNENISDIIVVSPQGWESFIYSYAQQFGISKLKSVVAGGETRTASIYNGLCAVKENGEDPKVLLVDANRPLIPQSVIDEVISLVDCCDCSGGMVPCYDSMFVSRDGETATDVVNRAELYREVGPECGHLSTLLEIYALADISKSVDTSTAGLAIQCGKKVRMAKGHIKCFKITTADDFELFKAFLAAEPLANITRRDAQ